MGRIFVKTSNSVRVRMKGWRRLVGTGISSLYGLSRNLRSSNSSGLRVLMYHAIGTTVPNDSRGLFSVSPARFKQHMEFLSARYAVSLIPLTDFPNPGIAVTFDDGYLDNLETAAPILASLNIPFTVFVTPGFIQSGNPIYLSKATLRELARIPGATIGAHGYTHRRLSECGIDDVRVELINSRKWLEDTLGKPITTMAYPHGAMNVDVAAEAAEAGYIIATSCREGKSHAQTNPLDIARTAIFAQDDMFAFRAKLEGDWDWLASQPVSWRQNLRKNLESRL